MEKDVKKTNAFGIQNVKDEIHKKMNKS